VFIRVMVPIRSRRCLSVKLTMSPSLNVAAPSLDLYELSLAINQMLTDPRRIRVPARRAAENDTGGLPATFLKPSLIHHAPQPAIFPVPAMSSYFLLALS